MFGFLLGCMVMVIVIPNILESLGIRRDRKGEGRGSMRERERKIAKLKLKLNIDKKVEKK